MAFELIDIAVKGWRAHPRLPGRMIGHVWAVLAETRMGHSQTHELSIPVWADAPAHASSTDIDMALMLRAAKIISRLKQVLDRTG